MSALPVKGLAQYNGFVFNNTAHTEEFSCRPKWDSAGRTIIYSDFTLTLSCTIKGRPTDLVVATAITRLTQPACGLVYNGRGVGNVQVNIGGPADCRWGPRPVSCVAKPYGGGNATRLTWTVEFSLPTCENARYEGPMEFAYKTSITVDKSGYSTRVYSGHLVIAQTRFLASDRLIRRSADEFRSAINPPLLFGFRRVPGTFDLSEDKCRLDFSITDEQVGPNAPPAGVIEAEADHSFRSTPGKVLEWTGVISATYEIPLDSTVTAAVRAFGALVTDRLQQLMRVGAGSRRELTPVPIAFTAADTKIYGKTTVHLSMQYRVAGAKLADILFLGRLWRPVPGARWETWAATMKTAWSSRGFAQLRFVPGRDDSIVDLCGQLPVLAPPTPPRTKTVELRNQPLPLPRPRPRPGLGTIIMDGKVFEPVPPSPGPAVTDEILDAFPAPTPERSWIDYSVGARFEADDGVVVGRALPSAPLPLLKSTGSGSTDAMLGAAPPAKTAGGTFTHRRAAPVFYVILFGYGIRARYPVPVPSLVSVNGAPVVPCNRPDKEYFEQSIVGNVSYPVYAARWSFRYVVEKPPSGPVPVVPNPLRT